MTSCLLGLTAGGSHLLQTQAALKHLTAVGAEGPCHLATSFPSPHDIEHVHPAWCITAEPEHVPTAALGQEEAGCRTRCRFGWGCRWLLDISFGLAPLLVPSQRGAEGARLTNNKRLKDNNESGGKRKLFF